MSFGTEKLEWLGYPMVKNFWRCLFVLTQSMNVTDTHIHTDTAWRLSLHLMHHMAKTIQSPMAWWNGINNTIQIYKHAYFTNCNNNNFNHRTKNKLAVYDFKMWLLELSIFYCQSMDNYWTLTCSHIHNSVIQRNVTAEHKNKSYQQKCQ